MNIYEHLMKYGETYLTLPLIILYWFTCVKLVDIIVNRNYEEEETEKQTNKRRFTLLIVSLISLLLGYAIYLKCQNKALPLSGGIFLGSIIMIMYYIFMSWNMYPDIAKLFILCCLLVGLLYGVKFGLSLLTKYNIMD